MVVQSLVWYVNRELNESPGVSTLLILLQLVLLLSSAVSFAFRMNLSIGWTARVIIVVCMNGLKDIVLYTVMTTATQKLPMKCVANVVVVLLAAESTKMVARKLLPFQWELILVYTLPCLISALCQ